MLTKLDFEEDTDLLESFFKYLNLELEFANNDEQIKDGKTEIINLLTKNVCKTELNNFILINLIRKVIITLIMRIVILIIPI